MRSTRPGTPHELMCGYYTQRATFGGFLVSEATVVSPDGGGYLGSPGIFTDEQATAWADLVDAVHAKGAVMYLQLFHAGRRSHVDTQPDRSSPVAPSVVDFEGAGLLNASPGKRVADHRTHGSRIVQFCEPVVPRADAEKSGEQPQG